MRLNNREDLEKKRIEAKEAMTPYFSLCRNGMSGRGFC